MISDLIDLVSEVEHKLFTADGEKVIRSNYIGYEVDAIRKFHNEMLGRKTYLAQRSVNLHLHPCRMQLHHGKYRHRNTNRNLERSEKSLAWRKDTQSLDRRGRSTGVGLATT